MAAAALAASWRTTSRNFFAASPASLAAPITLSASTERVEIGADAGARSVFVIDAALRGIGQHELIGLFDHINGFNQDPWGGTR